VTTTLAPTIGSDLFSINITSKPLFNLWIEIPFGIKAPKQIVVIKMIMLN
jgi:hypothetical protein